MEDILQPKLLCQDIAEAPQFWIDEEGDVIPKHTVYYLIPEDHVDRRARRIPERSRGEGVARSELPDGRKRILPLTDDGYGRSSSSGTVRRSHQETLV